VEQQMWPQHSFGAHSVFEVQPVQRPFRQVELPQQSQSPLQAPPGRRQQRCPAVIVPHCAYASHTAVPPL
jgi:hypothetical protein